METPEVKPQILVIYNHSIWKYCWVSFCIYSVSEEKSEMENRPKEN